MAKLADYVAKLVVRGGVEPPTFRFQVWRNPLPRGTADQELLDMSRRQLVDGDVAVRAAVTDSRLYCRRGSTLAMRRLPVSRSGPAVVTIDLPSMPYVNH